MSTPPPEITSTETYEAGWDQWPTGPRLLAEHAVRAGWTVRTGFSRGSLPGRADGTWKTADLVGVWMDGFGARAVAFWEREPDSATASAQAWSAQSTAIWMVQGAPFPYANLTELKEWLAMEGEVSPTFWRTARNRVVAARAKAKARPASPARAREHG